MTIFIAGPAPVQGVQAETAEWLTRVTAAGGTVSGTTTTAVDNFVVSSKANGTWSLFRRLNLCCGDFLASFVPLINTSGGTIDTNNSLISSDYSESLGWQTDGSTKWIDTGYTPTEATGGIAVYLRSTLTTSTQIVVGCRNTATTQIYRVSFTSGSGHTGQWGQAVGTLDSAGSLTAGFCHVNRTSSTLLEGYKNGTVYDSDVSATTPSTPSASLAIFAQNIEGGTRSAFCTSGTRVSGYSVDSGMNSTQAAAYYTDMQAFQTALARNV